MTLLRFLTMGSVDDGKSTLIGRLLHDTHAIYEDQFASVRAASASAGAAGGVDFSLVTDGLRAEREQGITIDVAYRHFSTPRRRFIIADTPGHEQYTRNMATGASTASLAVLLIDARKGVLPQTHRHAAIAWLLGVRSFAVAVNKMDLAGFRQDVFRKIESDFREFAAKLGAIDLFFVPVCSLDGDNVVERSRRMPWFTGPALLEYLETVSIAAPAASPLRFPVQNVIRSEDGSRRYAGQISSGELRRGDRVLILPSGRASRVASIRIGDHEIESCAPPQSVTVAIEDEIDIGRGDLIVDPERPPEVSRRMPATLLWMGREPMKIGHPYLIKHTSRQVCASVSELRAAIDPDTLARRAAATLEMNEFGDVEIETNHPLYADPYAENRATGAFIVIDPIGNGTVGAGMIAAFDTDQEPAPGPAHGVTVWFTGLSSAGKSTISKSVYEKLWARGYKVELLDGDVVRQQFSRGLGFSREDRDENIRRIGFAAELLSRNGVIVLVGAISPYRAVREEMREYIGSFLEVYVHAPLEVCEQRDLKGIYRRARAGELHGVTGVDDPYEAPLNPEVECRTDRETLAESTGKVLEAIERWLSDHAPKP